MSTLRFDPAAAKALVPLLVMAAAALALRIVLAAGFIAVDDAEYARAAARFLDGTFSSARQ